MITRCEVPLGVHHLQVRVLTAAVVDDYGVLHRTARVNYRIECSGFLQGTCSNSLVECDCVDPDEDPYWDYLGLRTRGPDFEEFSRQLAPYQDLHPQGMRWHLVDPPQCWESHNSDYELEFDPIIEPWAFIQGRHRVVIDSVGHDIDDVEVRVLAA